MAVIRESMSNPDAQQPRESPDAPSPAADAPRAKDEAIRARAADALRQGRFAIADDLLEAADVEVASLVENLRIYQAELELQYQELQAVQQRSQLAVERFTSFFNGLPVAELVVDARGLVVEANLAAQRLFDLKNSHFRQHYVVRLIADGDRAAFVQAWSRFPREETLALLELGFLVPGREEFIGDFHAAPLPGRGADARQYVCAVIDRTDAVIQRRSLNEARSRLGKRMRELSCLYDIARTTDRDDLDLDEMLEMVALRLPSAMRFPDRCRVSIDCGERHFGDRLTGDRTETSFTGWDGQTGRIGMTYDPWGTAGEAASFLAEECDMLHGIASRLSALVSRHEALAELRDNHQLVEAIFRRAPDAIELADPATLRLLDVNESTCQLLGFTREELLSCTVADFQAEMPLERLHVLAKEVLASGDARFETRHKRKDGVVIAARVHLRALHLRGRSYLLSVWRDITAEKAAEAEIRRLSTVVEQSPNPVVVTDLNTRIEYVNDAFVRKTGYAATEVIGRTPRILQSGKTPKDTYKDMWRTLSRGLPWRGEFINVTRDGQEQIEAATIIPLRQTSGRITHYVAVKEDITERKRLTEELERHRRDLELEVEARTAELAATTASLIEANNEQQALFDAAAAGIVFVRDRKVVRLNRTLAELFGYLPDEMIGQSTRTWYADEATFVAIGQRIMDAFRRDGFHCEDRELIRRDGTRFWGV